MSRRIYWVNPQPGLRHGISYAYYAKGCRCDRCYSWWHDHHEHRKAIDPGYMARRRAAAFRYRERQRGEREATP